MKLLILLFIIFMYVKCFDFTRNLQVSSSASDWRSWVEGSTKWCKETNSNTIGECCVSSSTAGRCSGTGSYVCSDSSGEPGTALCPQDTSDCGSYDINIAALNDSQSRTISSPSSNTVWVYKIDTTTTAVNTIAITLKKFTAYAWVYQEEGGTYSRVGSYNGTSEVTKTFRVSTTRDLYLVLTPNSSVADFSYTIRGYNKD